MNNIKHTCVLFKEFRTEKFSILIRFLEKGRINGLFIIDQGDDSIVYELTNGLHLKQEDLLHFSFLVEWSCTDKVTACTYFSGYTQQLKGSQDILNVDWMLVYENNFLANSYLKNGNFSIRNNYESMTEPPYPKEISIKLQQFPV